MRNEPWVWPEVGDAGTSGAGAVPLRSAQLMGQQKKKKKNDAESKQHKRTQMSHVHQQFPVWTADEMTSSGLYRYYRHYVVVAAVPHMCYR